EANLSGTTNNYFVSKTGFFHRDNFDGKVNYIPSDHSTVFGRYSLSRSFIFDPPALGKAEGNATLGGQLGNAHSRIQVVGLGGTYAFSPTLAADIISGFTRQRINAESTDIVSHFDLDTLHIPGTNGPDHLQGGIPAFQYNSFADFLLGLPHQVGKAVQNLNPNALRWSQWAWYGRDQYQVTSNLTINYGVRWEYFPMAYSDIGGARVLDPNTMNVLVGGSSGIPIDDGVDVGHGLFLPRLGIAYRPTRKNVVRAGYGISADANNWRFLRNAYPAVTISDFTGLAGNSFAPAASLTGLNAVGTYASLPICFPQI